MDEVIYYGGIGLAYWAACVGIMALLGWAKSLDEDHSSFGEACIDGLLTGVICGTFVAVCLLVIFGLIVGAEAALDLWQQSADNVNTGMEKP